MEAATFFETTGGNNYLYDSRVGSLIHVHPVMERIAQLYSSTEEGKEPEIARLNQDFPELSPEDLRFYHAKYLYLKKNGFFTEIDYGKRLSGKITAETVKTQLSNLDNLVFQVTNECNLQCRYCCYGELYENPKTEYKGPMSFDMAKKVIDFLVPYWNSSSSFSKNNIIGVGFYGGEPLLNFSLITQIISYLSQLQLKNTPKFAYNMTTNCMLLDRHMDYLVENEFSLLFSLDGNEIHDRLRVDKNNHSSFSRTYSNIKKFQAKYPDYFEKRVQFNSLLNAGSSVREVYNFIHSEFGKVPTISALSTSGIRKDKMEEFRKIYQPFVEDRELSNSLNAKSGKYRDAGFFFHYHLNNSYKQYYELLVKKPKDRVKIPTGTCLPFFRKMFVTSEGHILVCERIGLDHVLGKVKENVELDFERVANTYNQYFEAIKQQCLHCYHADDCAECFLQFPFVKGNPVCSSLFDKKQQDAYLRRIIDTLEDFPEGFSEINKMVFA